MFNMNQPRKINVCLFIRVSTAKQDYQHQVTSLTKFCQENNYNVVKVIANKISGTKANSDRHDIEELFSAVKTKSFTRVIVAEISRLSRTAKGIRSVIDHLHENKISVVFKNLGGLESLDQNQNETMVMNIIIAVHSEMSQHEKELQRTRVLSGLKNAIANGKRIGRPSVKEKPEAFLSRYKKVAHDLQRGLSLNEIVRLHSLAKNTVLKVKKLLEK